MGWARDTQAREQDAESVPTGVQSPGTLSRQREIERCRKASWLDGGYLSARCNFKTRCTGLEKPGKVEIPLPLNPFTKQHNES